MKTKIGARIRSLRKSKMLTQHELSIILHIPQSTIACWELGIHTPSVQKLTKLADWFNVSVDHMIGREPMSVNQEFQR